MVLLHLPIFVAGICTAGFAAGPGASGLRSALFHGGLGGCVAPATALGRCSLRIRGRHAQILQQRLVLIDQTAAIDLCVDHLSLFPGRIAARGRARIRLLLVVLQQFDLLEGRLLEYQSLLLRLFGSGSSCSILNLIRLICIVEFVLLDLVILLVFEIGLTFVDEVLR